MYKVYIKRLSDGVIREHVVNQGWDEANDFFLWTDGNFGCDCNRSDFFAQANGEPDPEIDIDCGDGKRFLVKIVLENGECALDEIGNGYGYWDV